MSELINQNQIMERQDKISPKEFYFINESRRTGTKLNHYGSEIMQTYGVKRWSEFFANPNLPLTIGAEHYVLIYRTMPDKEIQIVNVWAQTYSPIVQGGIVPVSQSPQFLNGHTQMAGVRTSKGISGLMDYIKSSQEQTMQVMQSELADKTAQIMALQDQLNAAHESRGEVYTQARSEFESQLKTMKEELDRSRAEVQELKTKIMQLEFDNKNLETQHKFDLQMLNLKHDFEKNESSSTKEMIGQIAGILPTVLPQMMGIPPAPAPVSGLPAQPQPQPRPTPPAPAMRQMSEKDYQELVNQYAQEPEIMK